MSVLLWLRIKVFNMQKTKNEKKSTSVKPNYNTVFSMLFVCFLLQMLQWIFQSNKLMEDKLKGGRKKNPSDFDLYLFFLPWIGSTSGKPLQINQTDHLVGVVSSKMTPPTGTGHKGLTEWFGKDLNHVNHIVRPSQSQGWPLNLI